MVFSAEDMFLFMVGNKLWVEVAEASCEPHLAPSRRSNVELKWCLNLFQPPESELKQIVVWLKIHPVRVKITLIKKICFQPDVTQFVFSLNSKIAQASLSSSGSFPNWIIMSSVGFSHSHTLHCRAQQAETKHVQDSDSAWTGLRTGSEHL